MVGNPFSRTLLSIWLGKNRVAVASIEFGVLGAKLKVHRQTVCCFNIDRM
jgi:hypothetical protein